MPLPSALKATEPMVKLKPRVAAREPAAAVYQSPSFVSHGLLDHRRICVRGFVFLGVDFAIVFGVEGAVLRVLVLGRHRENEAVVLAFEVGGVIAAVGIDHAFGERSGVDEFRQSGGEVAVLFLKAMLGAQHDAHVSEGDSLGIGAGRITGELGLIRGSGSRGLGYPRSRGQSAERESDGDDSEKRMGTFCHADMSPRATRNAAPGFESATIHCETFFMLLP